MRLWVLFLLWLLLPLKSVSANPTDLQGGVFIVHQVPELAQSSEPPTGDWCTSYQAYAIDSCDAQVNRVDVTGAARVIWFVLAAWFEDKQWCGVEFGLGEFDPRLFTFVEYGPCFPQSGLEIPSGAWPGPRTGTSIAVTGAAWRGNYVPVYFFAGYAYADPGPGVIPLSENPSHGFVGTANCMTPPGQWPAVGLGGLGVNADGVPACPEAPEVGCCWVGGECFLTYENECGEMGGHWVPPEYCLYPRRDCGFGGPPKICCIGEQCFFMVEQQCHDEGGVYHPEWDSCEPNPCVGVPVAPQTWGAIKARYR